MRRRRTRRSCARPSRRKWAIYSPAYYCVQYTCLLLCTRDPLAGTTLIQYESVEQRASERDKDTRLVGPVTVQTLAQVGMGWGARVVAVNQARCIQGAGYSWGMGMGMGMSKVWNVCGNWVAGQRRRRASCDGRWSSRNITSGSPAAWLQPRNRWEPPHFPPHPLLA